MDGGLRSPLILKQNFRALTFQISKTKNITYLVISSVLTARGVPGGTAARTFEDA